MLWCVERTLHLLSKPRLDEMPGRRCCEQCDKTIPDHLEAEKPRDLYRKLTSDLSRRVRQKPRVRVVEGNSVQPLNDDSEQGHKKEAIDRKQENLRTHNACPDMEPVIDEHANWA